MRAPRFAAWLLVAGWGGAIPEIAVADLPTATPQRNDRPTVRLQVALGDGTLLTAGFVGQLAQARAFAEAIETVLRAGPVGGNVEATLMVSIGTEQRPPVALEAGDAKGAAAAISATLASVLAKHPFVYADPPFKKPPNPYVRPRPTPPPTRDARLCGAPHGGCHEWEVCDAGLCVSVCGVRCEPPTLAAPRCPRDLICQDDVCFHQFCPVGEEGDPCPGPLSCAEGLECREAVCRAMEGR